MTAEIRFFWARLNANYWFYPATFAMFAAALAIAMVYLDRNGFAEFLNNYDWLVAVRPSGASDILTVMAGALIGVSSTVFSITIVAVSYASGTYGPRLLTNFLEDKGNQISLATFIGSFVYALIVLRSIRAEDETANTAADAASTALPGFAPQLSLLVAYILMAACVAVLIFFLNHVPSSIRINKVLEGIGERLIEVVRATYPVEDQYSDAREPEGGEVLTAWDTGYVQLIDFEDLAKKARECGGTFSLRVRTGDFVHRGVPLMDIRGCDPESLEGSLREDFTLGPVRTPEQDPQFLIDELAEIGLRALSPGINDPFTAITALHWMGAATAEIARRDLRKNVCGVEADDCPVIPRFDNFEHYLKRGFGSMRSAVAASPNACLIMFDAISNAAINVNDERRSKLLREQGRLLIRQARDVLTGPDLESVEERYQAFDETFEG
ncbi:DUF2254 domain-containing protein [Erythrobacter crassostreae]|uniref:DUF2254 domain-containing protein n=1 Tax=Erythrobacter crassostreae TaxID=2828328 RepID=A0A9X1F5D9_9SPHN|nr:DUF2254 domain-containing protein [Erythrobacter crassostrea]MBV7259130.1 DUF2254 domain-containing protein [Erythrobacter crassostrea]